MLETVEKDGFRTMIEILDSTYVLLGAKILAKLLAQL